MAKSINTTNTVARLATYPLAALNAELLEVCSMEPVTDPVLAANLLGGRIKTLDELTALAVNLDEGEVDRKAFQELLTDCFPEHSISERHVGHYLSLARKGNLGGKIVCRFEPVKAERKARGKFKVTLDVRKLTPEQRDGMVALGIDIPEYESPIVA